MSELEIQEAQKALSEVMVKIQEYQDKTAKEEIQNAIDNFTIYRLLAAADVKGIPERLTDYEIRWGFRVKVEDKKEFQIIKLLFGNLEHLKKEPVGDGRSNKVAVYLYPKKYPNLRWNTHFYYERKLTAHDKCKVITETKKRQTVICTR